MNCVIGRIGNTGSDGTDPRSGFAYWRTVGGFFIDRIFRMKERSDE